MVLGTLAEGNADEDAAGSRSEAEITDGTAGTDAGGYMACTSTSGSWRN